PIKPSTWLLWFGPAALLVATTAGIAIAYRRRTVATPPQPLATDEERRLREILERKA
ncbi:MAG: cytochrome c-type biogenesis protein CcmH, partial [Alphaproteobacteria bacterium]|nr:cytochrome c-type biogenesis protein CcmH [Alphaproteobacteria bacterium]